MFYATRLGWKRLRRPIACNQGQTKAFLVLTSRNTLGKYAVADGTQDSLNRERNN